MSIVFGFLRGNMKKLFKKNSNKGFTLVELIVVLVILAILAALLVPTLIGYIDEARAKKYLPNAKSCLDAAQAMFSQQYALNDGLGPHDPVVPGAMDESNNLNKDQDITNTQFAVEVLRLAGLPNTTPNGGLDGKADEAPYLFMVGVGSARENVGSTHNGHTYTEADKYTIYYAVYMETANAKAWYYYNGEWTTTNPRYNNKNLFFDENNYIIKGSGKGVRIQYYLIANHNRDYQGQNNTIRKKEFWDWLKTMK